MKPLIALALSLTAFSAQAITVSGVSISGPDCDSSNTSIAFSPDNATFSILYGAMDTTTQGMDRDNSVEQLRAPERKCAIKIGFRPAAGKQLELQQIDYRGFVSAPTSQVTGVIESLHRFLGGSVQSGRGRTPSEWLRNGILLVKQGPFQDDFVWSARYSPTANDPNNGLHLSNCTGTADFIINTTVRGYTSDINQDVSVVLDSADGRVGGSQTAIYKIVEKKCDSQNQSRDRICRNRACPN